MRFFTIFIVCCTLVLPGAAQPLKSFRSVQGPLPEHVCTLAPVFVDAAHSTSYSPAQKQDGATAVFDITYLNDDALEPWPQEAIDAFDYAASIWAAHLSSTIPIRVSAYWQNFGGCNLQEGTVLGNAGPELLVQLNIPGNPTAFYPIALANALADQDIFPDTGDIVANFNRSCDDEGLNYWYFGTDANPPPGSIDFVSVVLHELGHGLGFLGSANRDDGADAAECDGIAGNGCIRETPFIYDLFTFDASTDGIPLLDASTYPNPSGALGDLFTGQIGNGLFFDGSSTRKANDDTGALLYTPVDWSRGSSYSHLDESTYSNSTSGLMTPSLQTNEALHSPGPIVCGMFQDMGWPLGAACESLLPVSLTVFEAYQDEAGITLRWETKSERNNAGFEVQQRDALSEAWKPIGFVPGQGTTTVPESYRFHVEAVLSGMYHFRLQQVDFDGSTTLSPTVSLMVNHNTPFAWTPAYPNPFNPAAVLSFTVGRPQHVSIDMFDNLGRVVQSLYAGPADAHTPTFVRIDGSRFSSGTYWVVARGSAFHETQQVVLMK